MFYSIFFQKHLERNEKLLTFASAFENKRCYKTVAEFVEEAKKKEFFEKDLHKTEK